MARTRTAQDVPKDGYYWIFDETSASPDGWIIVGVRDGIVHRCGIDDAQSWEHFVADLAPNVLTRGPIKAVAR